MRFIIYVCLFSVLLCAKVQLKEQSENKTFQAQKIFTQKGVPWGMTFVDSYTMLITYRDGRIFLLNTLTQKKMLIDTFNEVLAKGQGGLMDIIASNSFKKDALVYYSWVKKTPKGGVVVVSQARFFQNKLIQKRIIFQSKSATNTNRHFGGRLIFDGKDNLLLGIGDRGVRKNGQNINNHAGSIVSLNIHAQKIIPSIYSYGHRNPQGLAYDKDKNILFSNEHGPRGGDEINIIEQNKNYGWPTISYGKEYWAPIAVGVGTHKKGMEQPIKVYIPSIAPSSLMVYSGKQFPSWKGNLFSGALVLRHLNRIVLNAHNKVIKEERLLLGLNQRIRNIIEDQAGFIYISTDSGNIYKLSALD